MPVAMVDAWVVSDGTTIKYYFYSGVVTSGRGDDPLSTRYDI